MNKFSGLFHRAIVQAGGIYCPWGYQGHQRQVKRLFKRAMHMENELRNVIVECMRKENATCLLNMTQAVIQNRIKVSNCTLAVMVVDPSRTIRGSGRSESTKIA